MSALKQIETVRNDFLADLEDVGEDLNQIEKFRSVYLGRKGKVASLFSLMGEASNEDRPSLGNSLNQLKTCLLYTSPSPRDRTRSRMPSSA